MKKNNYDVFISFKNTEEGQDREIANKIYNYLTGNGLKVFFSNVTLAENGIDNWDEAIYKAIEKSKIFIAVGTKKTYMELKHPQSERTAFLTEKKYDKKKVIFSYIGGAMTIDDLPNELRNIQCFQDKNKDDLANLLKFVLNSLDEILLKKIQTKPKSTDISLDEKSSNDMLYLDNLIKNRTFEIPNNNIKVKDENIFAKIFFIFFSVIVIIFFINLIFLSIYSFNYLIIFLMLNLVVGLFDIEKFIFLFVLIQILTFIGEVRYYFFG